MFGLLANSRTIMIMMILMIIDFIKTFDAFDFAGQCIQVGDAIIQLQLIATVFVGNSKVYF